MWNQFTKSSAATLVAVVLVMTGWFFADIQSHAADSGDDVKVTSNVYKTVVFGADAGTVTVPVGQPHIEVLLFITYNEERVGLKAGWVREETMYQEGDNRGTVELVPEAKSGDRIQLKALSDHTLRLVVNTENAADGDVLMVNSINSVLVDYRDVNGRLIQNQQRGGFQIRIKAGSSLQEEWDALPGLPAPGSDLRLAAELR